MKESASSSVFNDMFTRLKFNMRLFCGFRFLILFVAVVLSVKLLTADAIKNSDHVSINKSDIAILYEKINHLSSQINALQDVTKPYPKVKKLSYGEKKRILVTGGAGFVGSHLVDRLMLDGHEVTVVDNLFTGSKRNIEHWIGHPSFELIHHDIVNSIYVEVDQIYHLASPASPPHYMFNSVKMNTIGSINLLGLAHRVGTRILVASTSEVYGDPNIYPQSEDYWGIVNPIGSRSCFEEGKRVSEFIYGSGKQTRSFQYISDLINGLVLLMNSNYSSPINFGNPEEYTIEELAIVMKEAVGGKNPVVEQTQVEDDPQRRKPDTRRAKLYLGWNLKVAFIFLFISYGFL